jgi:dihydroorotase
LTAHLLESFGALDKLEVFVSKNGRAFYKNGVISTDGGGDIVRLRRRKAAVKGKYSLREQDVIPFWCGKDLEWEIDNQVDHMRV